MHGLATTSQEHDTDMAAAEAAAQAEAAAHCAEPGHEYYTCPRCQLDRPVADFLVGGEDGGQTLAHCCRACLYEEEQQAAKELAAEFDAIADESMPEILKLLGLDWFFGFSTCTPGIHSLLVASTAAKFGISS